MALSCGILVQIGRTSAPPVTAAPLTMSCWVYPTATDTNFIMSLSKGNTNTEEFRLQTSSNLVRAATFATPGSSTSTTTGALTNNTWGHAAAVFASATSRIAYINGTAATENVVSRAPSGIDSFGINTIRDTSSWANNGSTQRLADAAIWNVALNASEIAALAAGVRPGSIRPANLIEWHALHVAGTPLADWAGVNSVPIAGGTPTLVNAPPLQPWNPINPHGQFPFDSSQTYVGGVAASGNRHSAIWRPYERRRRPTIQSRSEPEQKPSEEKSRREESRQEAKAPDAIPATVEPDASEIIALVRKKALKSAETTPSEDESRPPARLISTSELIPDFGAQIKRRMEERVRIQLDDAEVMALIEQIELAEGG